MSLVERSFAGDADHFPARMGLTLFVIADVHSRYRRRLVRRRVEGLRCLDGNWFVKRIGVIESSADDLASARIGRGVG
jgi:hypothetical protein